MQQGSSNFNFQSRCTLFPVNLIDDFVRTTISKYFQYRIPTFAYYCGTVQSYYAQRTLFINHLDNFKDILRVAYSAVIRRAVNSESKSLINSRIFIFQEEKNFPLQRILFPRLFQLTRGREEKKTNETCRNHISFFLFSTFPSYASTNSINFNLFSVIFSSLFRNYNNIFCTRGINTRQRTIT